MVNLILPLVIRRITAALSILGSSTIIYAIISDRKRKLKRPYHRLMLMMSFLDIIQSSAMLVSTAALPRDSNISGAKGNERTCDAQGFFLIFGGLAVPLYNASLHIYYALIIQYGVSPERFTKFEPVLHVISILVPLFLAVFSAAFHGDVVPRALVCFPRAKAIRLPAGTIIILCFIICIVSMVSICWKVISQAKTMKKYTFKRRNSNASSPRSRVDEEKRQTIKQALLYISAFILTYSVPIIAPILNGGRFEEAPFVVPLLISIFCPLQGFWNVCFYIRPGLKYVMDANPNRSRLGAIIDVIFRPESTVRRPMQSPPSRRRPSTTRNENIATNCTMSSLLYQTKDRHSERKSSTTELDDAATGSDKYEEDTQNSAFTGSQARCHQDRIYRSSSIVTALDRKKEGLVVGLGDEDIQMISGKSQEVCNEVSNNNDTQYQESKNLNNSVDSAYIDHSSPRSEGSTIEEDLEDQSEVKFTPQVRRSSLVNLSSILSGLDDELLDVYSISDQE